MEQLINLVLDNLFFVLIVLFGLINLFGRSKPEEDPKNKKGERRPVPTQRGNNPPERSEMPQRRAERKMEPKSIQTRVEEMSTQTTVDIQSIEDQQQAQFDRLRRQFQTSHTQADLDLAEDFTSDISDFDLQSELTPAEDTVKVNTNLDQRLTQKGLIESVIMAEVLGPPKARQNMSNRYNRR